MIEDFKNGRYQFVMINNGEMLVSASPIIMTEKGWYQTDEYADSDHSGAPKEPLIISDGTEIFLNDKWVYDTHLNRYRTDWVVENDEIFFRPTNSDMSILEKLKEEGYICVGSRKNFEIAFKKYVDFDELDNEDIRIMLQMEDAVILEGENRVLKFLLSGMSDIDESYETKYHESFFMLDDLGTNILNQRQYLHNTSNPTSDRLTTNQMKDLLSVTSEGALIDVVVEDAYPSVIFNLHPNVIKANSFNKITDYEFKRERKFINKRIIGSDCHTTAELFGHLAMSKQEEYEVPGYMVDNYINYPEQYFSNRFQVVKRLQYASRKHLIEGPTTYIDYLLTEILGEKGVYTKKDVHDVICNSKEVNPILFQFNCSDSKNSSSRPLGFIYSWNMDDDLNLFVPYKMEKNHNKTIISESKYLMGLLIRKDEIASTDNSKITIFSPRAMNLYDKFRAYNGDKSFVEFLENILFDMEKKDKKI